MGIDEKMVRGNDSGIALACELFPVDLGNHLVDKGK